MKPDKEKEPCGNTALAGKKYVDCLQCHCKVPDSNFCIKCGAKLHKYCKCVILHKRYDCGLSKCQGKTLFVELGKKKQSVELHKFK